MNIEDLIASMTPMIYNNMKEALELGRWGDGREVTSEQKEYSLEALIRYEHLHNIPQEQRVGYVDMTNKRQQKNKKVADDGEQLIKIIE
ncbi:MAG: hypothetical protein ACI8SR_001956 [Oceanicoccus sp.]|jgi:uncharacterized protein YeaC (DUF1315 family)